MITDEQDDIIAIQPESKLEQRLVAELFSRLNNISEAPSHPEKIGSTLTYYTLDVGMYDLDHELHEEAECGVNADGMLDPEPGSRALIIVHSPDASAEDAEDDGGDATEEEIADAVESLTEGDDGGENEHTVSAEQVVRNMEDARPLADADYRELQALAQDASTTGVMDIPANQKTKQLVDDLRQFVTKVDAESEDDGE